MDAGTVGAVAATILAVLAAGYPILSLMNKWSANKASASASNAEAALYTHLSEQLTQNTDALNASYSERNTLIDKYAKVEVRMHALEKIESLAEMLKVRLDQKDGVILTKDEIIAEQVTRMQVLVDELMAKNSTIETQHTEIDSLKERVHQLELRLVRDEAEWCKGCPRYPVGKDVTNASHDPALGDEGRTA